jgi:hypothetical protein
MFEPFSDAALVSDMSQCLAQEQRIGFRLQAPAFIQLRGYGAL